jgi:outer membrane protein TolC
MFRKMKFFISILLLSSLALFLNKEVEAQNQSDSIQPEVIMYVQFPPLSLMIDSALATNAMVRFRDLGVTGKQCNLKSYRNYWTRNLGLQADIRYGTFDNFSMNTSEGQSPSSIATRSNQTNYGIGGFIKFPLQDVLNRRNLIIQAQSELDQAESMAEAQRVELRELVIRQYNDVLLKQRLLKIRSKNLSTSKINMEMVEKEFQNGVVSVTEYARIFDIVARSESDFETARTDYITAYMLLEEIVGFKFSVTQTTN